MTYPQTQFLTAVVTTLVRGRDTGGRVSLQRFDLPAGDRSPLHVHHDADEGFYVLSGNVTLWAGPDVVSLGPGGFHNAPRGVPHTYRVDPAADAAVLVLGSPSGFDEFVEAVGAPPDGVQRTLDPAEFTALAERFGIETLGPPGMLPAAVV